MIISTKAEFFKMARRSSTWVSIAALALLPLLLGLVMRSSLVETNAPPGTEVTPSSGYSLMILTMSTAMAFFAPLVASFISAELMAKELKDGTAKLFLIRPVSRIEFLLSKCLACLAHNILLMAALWLAALLVGGVLFHYGSTDASMSAFINISSPSGETSAVNQVNMSGTMSQTGAFLRLAASYGYLALSLFVVGLMTLLLSTVITNTAGVVVITLGAILGMNYLKNIHGISRYILSSHLMSGSLLAGDIDWGTLGFSLGILALYAVVFVLAAILIFYRKDLHT